MKKALVVVLAAFAFVACKQGEAANGIAAGGSRDVETVYDIAFIRMDSLVVAYDRFKELSTAFESKAATIQSDLETRARRLQNEVADFEEKATKGLETRARLAEIQVQIQNRGEQFETDRANRMNELAEEEQVMTNQVYYAITRYVAKFNADLRYKMILTSSGGSPVLHADPAMDITAEVLRGLNEEYAAEKASK